MKKLIAMLLTAAMSFSLIACGSTTTTAAPAATTSAAAATTAAETEAAGTAAVTTTGAAAADLELSADGTYPAETIKIGFVNYDTSAEQVHAIQAYFEYLQTAFNFEVIWSESLGSAEEELAFIEQCAAAGCKAIIGYYNEAQAESVKRAESLGMYYWGGSNKDDIYQPMKSSQYYLGSYYTGDTEYEFGMGIVDALVAAGSHKLIVMSGGKDYGVDFFVRRYEGIMDGIKKHQDAGYDISMVYEVPGWPGTEEFAAHQTAALETDADGLAGTLTSLMWIQPMQNANKFGQIKIAGVESVSEDIVGLMQGGVYAGICSEISGVFGMAIPMIINAVDGHESNQRNADGTAARVEAKNWIITNVDDLAYFASIEQAGGTWTFDIDDLKSIMGAYNPSFTLDDMNALYTAVSADEIKARRAD